MTDSTLYLLKAFFLGIIEGLTEFIPVSSTGHLILFGDWIQFESSSGKVFEVVIQLGSILAVMWIFRARLWQLIRGTLAGERQELMFTRNLLLAFLPAAVIGAVFIKAIKQTFYHPGVVAVTLVLGGLIMLWVERRAPHTPGDAPGAADDTASDERATARRLEDISWKQALGVGAAQCLAMIPGTSRSGATIIGGMIAGIQRKTATEFSFFLAMPTMLGAAVYDMYRNLDVLTSHDLSGIAVGFVAAFLSALVVVRAVLRFVANHTYRGFAWYRIALGLVVAAWLFAK
ncbi:undecaprenyl-diphosphate phosphatase [Bordetella hinzii]|uniref:Undecaprenyl-diphosphatase n=2 Tax=Bordetella hinzii TaxID=103855 RepID=A0AAN1RU21_9BORD|nr:undecaprenyl-diphosphate phosphatase [Bordetella hinzii]AKQ54559.1 Undecaprenyl-diphosphatase [Bordetella hinzii]AKQ59072.1 Undecaprenyl-diphosphatase [Bordetella hinzii]AZW15660.1 undecaprenyl-diphosphate phosphatase [Bordetella hinzii]KCB26546.1 putative undecaprenol kinase [Bordetella hinzii OH87 BAL007II]KCB31341.1 putative undecaprenol kinase [Bordetella hinzii L60]